MDGARFKYWWERLTDEGCSAESARPIAKEIATLEAEVKRLRGYISAEFTAYNKGELETFWEENPI